MQVIETETPSSKAGMYLKNWVGQHQGTTLCFIAGGSALEIIKGLNMSEEYKRRTIFMMGDERWSREPEENNYLQLLELFDGDTQDYKFISTELAPREDVKDFSKRLTGTAENIFLKPNVQVITILGIGEDGHTASIFPMSEDQFKKTYGRDSTYLHTYVKGLKNEHRASLSPAFIKNRTNHIIAYATGKNKKEILNALVNETKPLHEMPSQLIKDHQSAVLITDQDIKVG